MLLIMKPRLYQEWILTGSEEPLACEELQQSVPPPESLKLLRQKLQSLLKDGYPYVDQVAEVSGTSLRSFQRQLAKDHVSYSLLIDQVRCEKAISLLKDSTLKLIEISLELGYNDAANFTRAFKRWTGLTPSQFRRLHTDSSFVVGNVR